MESDSYLGWTDINSEAPTALEPCPHLTPSSWVICCQPTSKQWQREVLPTSLTPTAQAALPCILKGECFSSKLHTGRQRACSRHNQTYALCTNLWTGLLESHISDRYNLMILGFGFFFLHLKLKSASHSFIHNPNLCAQLFLPHTPPESLQKGAEQAICLATAIPEPPGAGGGQHGLPASLRQPSTQQVCDTAQGSTAPWCSSTKEKKMASESQGVTTWNWKTREQWACKCDFRRGINYNWYQLGESQTYLTHAHHAQMQSATYFVVTHQDS